jgi:hypothetical protein
VKRREQIWQVLISAATKNGKAPSAVSKEQQIYAARLKQIAD